MELKTYGEVKNHLLKVIDFATHNPTKENPNMSKIQYWNLIMSECLKQPEDSPCTEQTSKAVLKEFPEYLRPDFYTGETDDEFYSEDYIGL